jgi:two-component system, OmpR family, response regulator
VVAHVDAVSRVLVLEGEPRTAHFAADGLRHDGHEVVVAEDGDVAVFLAGTEHFDVLVLDLGQLDAPELATLERIQGSVDGVPVVVLSERDDPDARDACQEAGAAAVLARPLVVQDLCDAVSELLVREAR